MIDVDRFTLCNDNYGHAAGDQCLRAVANELRRQRPRKGDLVARFAGEELCVLMPNTDADADADDATMVAERIRRGQPADVHRRPKRNGQLHHLLNCEVQMTTSERRT